MTPTINIYTAIRKERGKEERKEEEEGRERGKGRTVLAALKDNASSVPSMHIL